MLLLIENILPVARLLKLSLLFDFTYILREIAFVNFAAGTLLLLLAPAIEAPHVDFVPVEIEVAGDPRDEGCAPLLVFLELGLQVVLLLLREASHAT